MRNRMSVRGWSNLSRRLLAAFLAFGLSFALFGATSETVSAEQEKQTAPTYSLAVNYSANVVTAYLGDIPVRAMLCSTGTATPRSGTYALKEKYRWKALFHESSGQYSSRITGGVLFHSVPCTSFGNPASMKVSYYDKLGTRASMECIRLRVIDATWIYDNCPSGTPVSFYSDPNNAGPLGKPVLFKISDCPSYLRGWDPTDPDPANPWHEYEGAAFDPDYYYTVNADLQDIVGKDAELLRNHWLTQGIKEGRVASEELNLEEFKASHPELAKEFGNDNYKYVKHFNIEHTALAAAE